MILSKEEIIKEIKNRNISISPFDLAQLNPNSYNYKLGEYYKKQNKNSFEKIPKNGITLNPYELYLFTTLEKIGSSRFVISLIGRSSLGRLGLFVQIDSDLSNLDKPHRWTLEINCVQSIVLYPKMILGQVSFWDVKGKRDKKYTGNYSNFNYPKESYLIHDIIRK